MSHEIDIGYSKPQELAVKAFAEGVATKEQQKIAFNFIVEHLGWNSSIAYVNGDVNATHIMLGRQFVARMLNKIVLDDVTVKSSKDKEKDKDNE